MLPVSPLSRLSLQKNMGIKRVFKLDLGSNASLATPALAAAGIYSNYRQLVNKTTGWDGLAYPDSLYDYFGDGVSGRAELYMHMLSDPTVNLYVGSAPLLSDYIENSINDITDTTADGINTIAALRANGFAPKYIESRTKKRADDIGGSAIYNAQSPLSIIRGASYYTGLMSDITEIYHTCYLKIDPDIASKLATSTGYITFGFEYKTGGGRSAAAPTVYNFGLGDFRIGMLLQKVAGGLYLRLHADNQANGLGVAGLDLLPSYEEYWSVDTLSNGSPDPAKPFTPGKWYFCEFYHRRGLSHTDLSTGHTWMVMTDMATGTRIKMLEKVGGVHMGVYELPIYRMYLADAYSNGITPYFTQSAGHQMWNKYLYAQ